MKKLLPFLIIISLLSFNITANVYAQYAVTVVGDPADTPNWLENLAKQGMQLSKEIITSASTLDLRIKGYFLDPAAKMVANAVLETAKASTLNWVKSGFKGSPTFISNPDIYLKNMTTGVVRAEIADLSSSNNPFSGSIINTIVAKTRNGQSSLSSQIAPTLSTAIQGSVCTDAGLTKMAESYISSGVSVGGDKSVDTIKKELRNEMCSSGATAGAPAVAQQKKLNDCFANDFNCGGWGAWLDLTSNPNNTKNGQMVAVETATAQAQAKKIENEKSITTPGGGLATKGPCLDTPPPQPTCAANELWNGTSCIYNAPMGGSSVDSNGCTADQIWNGTSCLYNADFTPTTLSPATINNPNKVPCQNEEVATPATTIENTLKSSLDAGVISLANAHGIGDTLSSLLSSTLTGLMGQGLSSMAAAGKRVTLDTLSDMTNTTTAPTNTTISNQPTGGMAVAQRDEFIKKIDVQININLTAAKNLKGADNDFITDINTYEGRLGALSGCYTSLISAYPSERGDASVINWTSFVNTKTQTLENKRKEILAEFPLIDKTIAGTASIRADLTNTLDPNQMSTIYNDYQDKFNSGYYVGDLEYSTRKSEELTAKGDFSLDKDPETYLNACHALRNRLDNPFIFG